MRITAGGGFRDENAKDFEALYRTASRYYCDTECAKAVEKQPFRVIFPNFFVRAILPPSPSSSFGMLGAAVVSNTHKTKLTKCVVRRHHDPYRHDRLFSYESYREHSRIIFNRGRSWLKFTCSFATLPWIVLANMALALSLDVRCFPLAMRKYN